MQKILYIFGFIAISWLSTVEVYSSIIPANESITCNFNKIKNICQTTYVREVANCYYNLFLRACNFKNDDSQPDFTKWNPTSVEHFNKTPLASNHDETFINMLILLKFGLDEFNVVCHKTSIEKFCRVGGSGDNTFCINAVQKGCIDKKVDEKPDVDKLDDSEVQNLYELLLIEESPSNSMRRRSEWFNVQFSLFKNGVVCDNNSMQTFCKYENKKDNICLCALKKACEQQSAWERPDSEQLDDIQLQNLNEIIVKRDNNQAKKLAKILNYIGNVLKMEKINCKNWENKNFCDFGNPKKNSFCSTNFKIACNEENNNKQPALKRIKFEVLEELYEFIGARESKKEI